MENIAIAARLAPKGSDLVKVKTKPGWIGYIAEIPWGQAGVCVDIQWLVAPPEADGSPRELPRYAVRFPESMVERIRPGAEK